MNWIKIDKQHPLSSGVEVMAYNEEWIHPDFCPQGVRIGFLSELVGFVSAVYESENETYGTCSEEGDDYDSFEEAGNGTHKTFYINKEGHDVEGHRPNMPTHYMEIKNPRQIGIECENTLELISRLRKEQVNMYRMEYAVGERLGKEIIQRIQYLDPENQNGHKEEWVVYLPFALRLLDEASGVTRCYPQIEVHEDRLLIVRYDDEDNDIKELVVTGNGNVIDIYQGLHRMGFFDDKYEADFMNRDVFEKRQKGGEQ